MKRIISSFLIATLLLQSGVSCGLLKPKMNVAKFLDESDSESESENTETGTVDVFTAPEQRTRSFRDPETNRSEANFDESGDGEKASVKSSNGDRATLSNDNSAKSSTEGRSEVTTKDEVKDAVDSASSGTDQGSSGSLKEHPSIREIIEGMGLKDADPDQGNVGGGRKGPCDGCDGSGDSAGGSSSEKKEISYANLDELEGKVNEEKAKFKGKVDSYKDGSSQSRAKVGNSAKGLLDDHNIKVEKIKTRFRDKGLETQKKVKYFTDPSSRLGQEIRDADGRFNENANPKLRDIHKKLLKEADRNAYTGNINDANEFLKGANRVADLSRNPDELPSEVFDPNHKPDYNPGNFNEKNERIKAGRVALDLYDAAGDLNGEKSPVSGTALVEAGTLLDLALGAARFASVVDVPLSAMELITGKTLAFDASGNPMIVEASTVTRAAAALTLGLTAAALVTTGGLAAVGVAAAMGFIPGIVRAAKNALRGIGKTEKAAETVVDVERTVDKIVSKAENLGLNLAATNSRLGEKALGALNDSRVVEAAKDWGTSKDGVNQLLEHSIGKIDEAGRLDGLERRAGLASGALSNAGSKDPGKVADAVAQLDSLAKDILSKGTTKATGPNKATTWVEGVGGSSDGIAVIRFEEKIQTVFPMKKQKFESLGVQ